ncbi:nucleolar transcription factor 1-A-like [Homalodisca vitripennis]|uniref:nucleolar transcription factor 1-A-like n=1 Tax=Homalodisca vitripennis TaxID=197043 RepID=UPI001EEC942D|nr:nucleolar transcription factor 1-A-like [Homalodisca vitripennis]XP_046673195.1 nucleolar transcription factor 1-A-like [Homalodisca vitripennis]
MSNSTKKSKKKRLLVDNEEDHVLQSQPKKVKPEVETVEENDEEVLVLDNEEEVEQKTAKEENQDWNKEDYNELIKRMEEQIPKNDTKSFTKRAELLDWNLVKFGDHSVEECQEKWKIMRSKVRHFRLLSEVLQDAKVWAEKPWAAPFSKKKTRHPEQPPRPLSSFMLFYMDKKDKIIKKHPSLKLTDISRIIGEKYKAMSDTKKSYYNQRALEMQKEYRQNLAKFYEKYPEYNPTTRKQITKSNKPLPPFKLYLKEKLKKHEQDEGFDQHEFTEKYKEMWKNLSFKKKACWIRLAKEEEEKYLEHLNDDLMEDPENRSSAPYRSVISKEENLILDRLAGKPEKPPNSAYSLFSKLMLQDKHANHVEGEPKNRMREVALKWKEIPDDQKKTYAETVQHMHESYKLDFANYLESLPEDKKAEELAKLQPKKRTSKTKQKSSKKGSSRSKSPTRVLFKNEPEKPPVTAWDLYKIEFAKKNSSLPNKTACKRAALMWKNLSKSELDKYKKKHDKMKKQYMIEFEAFLKTLDEKELKEYSALKTAKIGEELDDDDVDEELSSDEEENSSSTASDSAGDSDSGVSEEDED